PHAACAAMGWVPREILERPVVLRSGTGNASDEVTTKSDEARRFYLQGLNYLHGYVWIEAARSFNQALRLDPELAMAHWGLSRVYSGLDDHEAAVEAAKRAKELAAKASEREQRRIALRLQQLDSIADLANVAAFAAYRQGLDRALARDIDDIELWLLRGNAEEPTAAGRGQRGGAGSTAFYLEALRRAPDNAAAHHYLIHSYETINQIDSALVHGEAYAGLSPAIPHAHHMWAHDLRRVGRIDEAIAAFKRTDELERAYYAAEGISPEMDWHHVHNLDLLAMSHQHKGQMKEAETLLRQATALRSVTQYHEFNQKALAVFLLSRNRLRDALAAAGDLQKGNYAPTRVIGYSLAGHVQLRMGNKSAAREMLAQAERETAGVPELVGGISINRTAVMPYVDMLRGEVLLREGDAKGRDLLKQVQAQLRALPGPDAWSQAMFRIEDIARVARAVGDWELAEHTAKQMMAHDAAYAGSHYATALVAKERGDANAVADEVASARRYWRDADADLPELAQLRKLEQPGKRQAAAGANRVSTGQR
ncbi:MAG TPA: hypothetical protein VFR59_04865, partial [Steroidobacteraceae bacterium]|nr:hypothetical protein [Steroidobacteraceae bacterium]